MHIAHLIRENQLALMWHPSCFFSFSGGKKQVVIEQTNLCSEFKLENIYYGVKNVKKWQTLEPAKISAK